MEFPQENLDGRGVESVVDHFTEIYEQRYGMATQLPEARVEIVSAACDGFGEVSKYPRVQENGSGPATGGTTEKTSRDVYWDRSGQPTPTPVYDGMKMAPDTSVAGPVLIDLPDTTVVVRKDQRVHKNSHGDYELFFDKEAQNNG